MNEKTMYDIQIDDLESATARELVALGPRRGLRIGVHPVVILLCELVVVAARAYTDGPYETFLDRFAERMETKESLDVVLASIDEASLDALDRWAERLKGPRGARFVKNLLGAATSDRLRNAFQSDMRVVGPALLTSFPRLFPMAHAFDTCMSASGSSDGNETPFLSAIFTADHVLRIWSDEDYDLSSIRSTMLPSDLAFELSSLAASMRAETSERVVAKLDAAETPLTRKIRGARDVLGSSRDAVSQAANSMVEFIDRLLRSSFTDTEVLLWIDHNIDSERQSDLIYDDRDMVRPTVKGRALCFISAGQPPGDSLQFYSQVAESVRSARRVLQRLKHADVASDEIPDELGDAIAVIEAAVAIIFGFAWLSLDDEVRTPLLEALTEVA